MATLFRLVIEDDEGKTTLFPLGARAVTIGRRVGNTIRLMERNVSRRHARFARDSDGSILVEDLDSYNGVLLNGDRIEGRATVGVGDVVGIGSYSVVLEARTQDDEEEAAAPRAADTLVETGPLADSPTDPPEAPTPTSTPHLDTPGLPLRVARPRLIAVRSSLAGRSFVLGEGRTLVGRGTEADLVIDHLSISRLHAAIETGQEGLRIDDLGSANGIRVDGQLVASHWLVQGELIELGDVGLRYVPGDADFVPTDEDVRALEQVGLRAPTEAADPSAALTVPDPALVERAARREAESAEEPTLRRAPRPGDAAEAAPIRPARARAPAPAAWTGSSSHEIDALRDRVDPARRRSTWLIAVGAMGLVLLAGLGGTWLLVDSGRAVSADRDLQAAFDRGDDDAVLERFDRDRDRFADPVKASLTRDRAARRRGAALAREGVEAFREGRWEEAIEALERCVALASEMAVCHRNLAVAYTRAERYQDAARHYRLFLDLEPDHPEGEEIRRILKAYEAGDEKGLDGR